MVHSSIPRRVRAEDTTQSTSQKPEEQQQSSLISTLAPPPAIAEAPKKRKIATTTLRKSPLPSAPLPRHITTTLGDPTMKSAAAQPVVELSQAEKSTISNLDKYIDVVTSSLGKNKTDNSAATSVLDRINIAESGRREGNKRSGGADLFGSFQNSSERHDFFDIDSKTAMSIIPPLPNTRIPIFPEDFPANGPKEWPLSWWGIQQPSQELLMMHERIAEEVGYPIRKRKKNEASTSDKRKKDETKTDETANKEPQSERDRDSRSDRDRLKSSRHTQPRERDERRRSDGSRRSSDRDRRSLNEMVRPIFKLRSTDSGGMELEFRDKEIFDHPDNSRLEKYEVSGDDFSPLSNGRRCTDILFLLLIICSWVVMTGLGLAAMGILPSQYIKQGDPTRLINGLDYHGNLCGVTTFITSSGEDVVNLPKAYPLPNGLFVCVDSCPKVNNLDRFICEYEVQHEITEALNVGEEVGSISVSNSTEKSLYMFYTGQKQCMPMIESTSFLGYCIPSKPVEEILLGDMQSQNLTTSNNQTVSNVATLNYDTITVSSQKKASSNNESFDIIMSDVNNVRYVIFGFGCGVSMAFGIFFLIVIQLPYVLHLMVWSMSIAIDCGLVYAGYYTKGISATWEVSGRPGNEALALYYGSYVLHGLAGLWLVTILFLRKRILLAVSCVKEASRAISAMPIMTLCPVCQTLSLFAFTVVWGVYMAYLGSSGEITANCVCPDDYRRLPDFYSNTSRMTVIEDTLNNTSLEDHSMCNEGCFMYKELTYSTNTKYAGLYMVLIWFWTTQFIVSIGQLVVALAVSVWYFTRDRKKIGNYTFIKSFCLVSIYHLGTAAFGSLIMAIIKTIRVVLTYIQKRATKSKLRLANVILRVLACLLWCLEKCLKFVNKQAYIQTASRMSFFLILRNALRISAVSIVSQAVLLVNKVFITVASTTTGYYYLETYYGDQLNSLMVPTLIIAICSYAVSEMFDEVFGMAISTILQCFVADEEMYEPDERFAPKELAGTFESTQEKYKKRMVSNSSIDVDK